MKKQTKRDALLVGVLILQAVVITAMTAQIVLLSRFVSAQGRPAKLSASAEDPLKGEPGAPVTIVEFSDFQCPYCARFAQQTLPQLLERYVATGKARFVYRDFPLDFHPVAQKAAEAAECADEQGKFWEYHDLIFARQASLSLENLKSWAVELGLDAGAFNTCLDSGAMAGEVGEDAQAGRAAGVTGTPAFLVNGQLITGARPVEAFAAAIEQELAAPKT